MTVPSHSASLPKADREEAAPRIAGVPVKVIVMCVCVCLGRGVVG